MWGKCLAFVPPLVGIREAGDREEPLSCYRVFIRPCNFHAEKPLFGDKIVHNSSLYVLDTYKVQTGWFIASEYRSKSVYWHCSFVDKLSKKEWNSYFHFCQAASTAVYNAAAECDLAPNLTQIWFSQLCPTTKLSSNTCYKLGTF